MKSKPGAAMVEMGDCYAVDRAITHLNNNFLFGQRLNVWWVHPVRSEERGHALKYHASGRLNGINWSHLRNAKLC